MANGKNFSNFAKNLRLTPSNLPNDYAITLKCLIITHFIFCIKNG